MALRMKAVIQIGLVCVLLAACVPGPAVDPQTNTTEDGAGEMVAPDAAAEPVAQVASPPLVYSWDTGFSAFLSPPIEVRRLARDDCLSAGYEVAAVETMALEGSTATASFICRGDFE